LTTRPFIKASCDFTEINSTVLLVSIGFIQNIPRQDKLICSGNSFSLYATPRSDILPPDLNIQRTEWLNGRFSDRLFDSLPGTGEN